MKPSAHKPPGYPTEIYCDESLDRGGYDLLGGLWLTRASARRFRRKAQAIRDKYNYPREIKWKKATGSSLSPFYREYGEMAIDHLNGKTCGFHCIVIPKRFVDYKTYHGGDRELAFYKFWHLLFRKRVEPGTTYVIRMDKRSNRVASRLNDLRDVLNNCGRADHGLGYDCCREVIPVDSKKEELVQAVDLILGAVGYHYAGNDTTPWASPGKCELATRMARKLGKETLKFKTGSAESCFNVWLWQPTLG